MAGLGDAQKTPLFVWRLNRGLWSVALQPKSVGTMQQNDVVVVVFGYYGRRNYSPQTQGIHDVRSTFSSELARLSPNFATFQLFRLVVLALSFTLTVLIGSCSWTLADDETSKLVITESDSVLAVTSDGRTVLTYNKRPPELPPQIDPVYARDGFLHPVVSPAGHTVTGLYPADHAHQNGFFNAWVNTTYDGRKIDFWNVALGTGRVAHSSVVTKQETDSGVRFEVELRHRTVKPPVIDILGERWTIAVTPPRTDVAGGQNLAYNTFDLESVQTALTDVPLVVEEYRYGGFAYRGPLNWLAVPNRGKAKDKDVATSSLTVRNDADQNRVDSNHQATCWVVFSGPAMSPADPSAANETGQREPPAPSKTRPAPIVSVVVLSAPSNYRAPQIARVHPTKPYFCFAPCVNDQFVIDKSNPLRSTYRVLVVDGTPTQNWIRKQYETWIANLVANGLTASPR